MKKFLIKIFIFCAILGLVFVMVVFLPPTPKSKSFVLFAKTQKDSLLQNVESPRIIFIGGSNIVYGLNSELIKNSLNINPINTGSIATVGLSFMMDNTLPYIKSSDIVVLVPEYQQYFGSFAYGNQGLLRLLIDVDPSGFKYLKKEQWYKIVKSLPKFIVSKIDPNEYFNIKINPAYRYDIFNEYGDSSAHWVLEKQGFEPDNFSNKRINRAVLKEIKSFERKVTALGASLFVSYPCFQETSFELNKDEISLVEKSLEEYNLNTLGTADRYRMPDSLMFDTPYHLIKTGVDIRTEYLIQDLKGKEELKVD